jgi:lipopolysaccharide/colanic/teichoic acid biosynthesis glycosyltransferase
VVVAEPGAAELLRLDLGHAPERPASIVAVLDPDGARDVRDGHQPLVDVARSCKATVVVFDRTGQADDALVAQAAALHATGVRIRTLSLFYEEWLGKLPAGELERVSLMFDIGELHRWRYGRTKRLADVVVAVASAPFLVLAVPLVWLGNLVGNRGPLLYRQARIGRHGQEFQIVKFRTMVPAGEQPANEWTSEDDPRITRFGSVLRRTHVDELPQLVNILRGELSLVGPRPEQPHYVAELSGKLPFYEIRHLVRPGLTGWAQVKYGYAGNETDALEKLQYEFFYLRRQGLLFDASIVGWTLRSVLGGQGR